jgi:septum site-determining protein MinD
MTRIITCISGKGGVGKTMLVANLGAALSSMGKDIIVIDANLTTPNLGLHLGIPLFPLTLHDVLKGRANIKDVIYGHDSGLKIIPAGISLRDLRGTDAKELPNALLDLLGNAEIVLLDAAAGLGRETLAAIEAADEVLLITNPDLPSVTDVLKATKLAEQMGAKVTGVVINRVTKKKHEMSTRDIMDMLDNIDVLGEIPDDTSIQKAITNRMPVVQHSPNSDASHQIKSIAAKLIGREYNIPRPWHKKFFTLLGR